MGEIPAQKVRSGTLLAAAVLLAGGTGCGSDGAGSSAAEDTGPALTCAEPSLSRAHGAPFDTVTIRGVEVAADSALRMTVAAPGGGEPRGEAYLSRPEDGTLVLHVPLHPSGSPEGGPVELRLGAGDVRCPPLSFTIAALPPAPGALGALVDAIAALIDRQAATLGLPHGVLDSRSDEPIPVYAVPLLAARLALDDPDNPNSLRAVSEGRAVDLRPSAEERDLAERLVAHIGLTEALETHAARLSQPARLASLDAGAAVAAINAAQPAGFSARSCQTFQRDDAEKLDFCMELSRDAEFEKNGASGKVLKDLGMLAGLGGLAPSPIVKFAGELGGMLTWLVQTATDRVANTFPSRFVGFRVEHVEPRVFLEDSDEIGQWSGAVVRAVSNGWDLSKPGLETIKQITGLAGAAKGLLDADPSDAVEDVLNYVLGQLTQQAIDETARMEGPEPFRISPNLVGPVDVTSSFWSDHRVVTGDAIEWEGHRIYSPARVGTSLFELRTEDGKFGGRQIRSEHIELEVRPIRVTASPDRETVEPGETVEIEVRVEDAEDPSTAITAREGSVTPGKQDRDRYTFRYTAPTREEDFPDLIRVRSTSRGGLRAEAGAPPREAAVSISLEMLRVVPAGVCLRPGEEATFSASLGEESNPPVRWSARRGAIDGDGRYRAPRRAGDDRVTAILRSDPQLRAHAGVAVRDCAWTMTIGSGDRAGFYWGREASLRPPRDPGSSGSGAVLLTDEETYLGLTAPVRVTIGLDGVPPGETGPFRSGGISNQATVIFNDSARSGSGRAAMGGLLEAAGPLASNPYSAYWTETPVGRGASVETADGPLPLDRIHTLRGSFDIPDPANLVITANEAGRVAGRVSGEFLTLVAGSLSGPWAGDSAAFDAVQIEIAFDAEAGEHERRLESARDAVMGDGGGDRP